MNRRARERQPVLQWSAPLRDRLQNSPLLSALAHGDAPQRIAVCGCHRGAGASTVALNLAVLLRERLGTPVVLVEANVRRPVLAGWLGRSGGAFNRLAEPDTALAEVLEDDGPTGLKLATAAPAPHPLLLLQAAAPRLREASGRLLVDLPPVLDSSDATLIAPQLDAVLLVLEAEGTRWEVAKEARRRLEAAGARVIGAVLNKKPQPIPGWLYRLL